VEGTINQLVEMGFSKEKAEKALNKTGWSGVEAAMEWLLAHPDFDPNDDDDEDEEAAAAALEAAKNADATPKAPLTEEEKAEKLKRLEELRVKKRAEREAQEKADEQEKERKRVAEGKAMGDLKQKLADQEIIRNAERMRREKEETKAAKERVKAQIEADKKARKEREMQERTGAAASVAPAPTPASQMVQKTESGKYEETRIQMRLPDGTNIVQKFKAKEPLSAVRLYVDMNRKDGVSGAPAKLMTNFPKKIFSDEDYEAPLETLGLVPSAVVIVSK